MLEHLGSATKLQIPEPRMLVVADGTNPRVGLVAKSFGRASDPDPNVIVVIGGDGFMLRTIRRYWRRGLPFLGVNVGHRGFLLNEPEAMTERFPSELVVYQLPLLEVSAMSESGKTKRRLAFNDVWVERAKAQTAWIEIVVSGVTRIAKLVADAALVATPAGSTAYAMAMGASPLPLDARALVLVASNSVAPADFRPCYLSIDSRIEFRTLDPKKRPIIGVVDGVRQGKVVSLRAEVSKTAKVQLAFVGGLGLAEKLAKIQFANTTQEPASCRTK